MPRRLLDNFVSGRLSDSSIAKETIWTFVMKLIAALSGFFVAVLLARLLGPDGYGTYAYAMALVMIFVLLAEAGLPVLVTRETAQEMALDRPAVVMGVWQWSRRLSAVLSVIVVIGAAGVVYLVSRGQLGPENRVTLWALLLVPLIAQSNLRGAALRGLGRIVEGQLPGIVVRPFVFLALLVALVLLPTETTPVLAMALHVLAGATAFLAGIWLLSRHSPSRVDASTPHLRRREWLSSALPLALVSGMVTINDHADIVILGMFESADQIGIYKVAVQMAGLAWFGLYTVNSVVAPRFARLYAEGDLSRLQRLVTGSSRAVLLFSALVTALFLITGQYLLPSLFGPAFGASYAPMAILLGGQLVNSGAGSVGTLLSMTGHERVLARAVGTSALINVVLNFALVPNWGTEGAAVATAISLIVWNVWLWLSVKRRLGIDSLAVKRLSSKADE